jgi:hypothetical protein
MKPKVLECLFAGGHKYKIIKGNWRLAKEPLLVECEICKYERVLNVYYMHLVQLNKEEDFTPFWINGSWFLYDEKEGK